MEVKISLTILPDFGVYIIVVVLSFKKTEKENDFVLRENEDLCFKGLNLEQVEPENHENLSVLSETT